MGAIRRWMPAITTKPTQRIALEDVQHLAEHMEPRTTGLYDRRQKKVTRKICERIASESSIICNLILLYMLIQRQLMMFYFLTTLIRIYSGSCVGIK